MFSDKKRYGQDPNIVRRSKTTFNDPLKWPKDPAFCFTCSWSDFFIEEADGWREEAYEIMRATPWITYQVLTKRTDRLRSALPEIFLPNMWIGSSVENQKYADERREDMRFVAEACGYLTFVSYEPALENVDWSGWEFLRWWIGGGESGSSARPLDITWLRAGIKWCHANGIAPFIKQVGAHPMSESCSRKPEETVLDWGSREAELFRMWPNETHFGNRTGVSEWNGYEAILKDRKGGAEEEWPEDIRVREFPQ